MIARSFSLRVNRCEPMTYDVATPIQRGQVARFEGNYRDYEADLKRRNPELAENPHRIKYKALVRQ